MALVGNRRRHLSLTLEVPLPTPAASRHHFTAPPPPATAVSSSAAAAISDYEKLSVLGHGNGGTVYKVRPRQSSSVYALKVLHNPSDPAVRHHIRREITAFRRASDSPFVLRLHSVLPSANSSSAAFLMDYMDAGTLDSLLRRHSKLTEAALPEIARQLLLGLSYIHSQKIAHRDIKPSNILLNSSGEIKISDFGVSRVMNRNFDRCNTYVGTCAYMSRERFDPDTYGAQYDGYAADVWSLGLTVMELYLGRFPLLPQGQRPDWATLMCAICFGDPPSLPEAASVELRGFVECCLQKDPNQRCTAAELLRHPFVNRDLTESRAAFMELVAAEN